MNPKDVGRSRKLPRCGSTSFPLKILVDTYATQVWFGREKPTTSDKWFRCNSPIGCPSQKFIALEIRALGIKELPKSEVLKSPERLSGSNLECPPQDQTLIPGYRGRLAQRRHGQLSRKIRDEFAFSNSNLSRIELKYL
jgi:hypothetical protein